MKFIYVGNYVTCVD